MQTLCPAPSLISIERLAEYRGVYQKRVAIRVDLQKVLLLLQLVEGTHRAVQDGMRALGGNGIELVVSLGTNFNLCSQSINPMGTHLLCSPIETTPLRYSQLQADLRLKYAFCD